MHLSVEASILVAQRLGLQTVASHPLYDTVIVGGGHDAEVLDDSIMKSAGTDVRMLGLFDDQGRLHHVGITSSFTWDKREALAKELEPLREGALEGHPWGEWAEWAAMGTDGSGQRLPGATSRWNRGKDLSWEPLRAERVVEVAYDHLQGDRFRHATTFKRWRPDKAPSACRYDQLETTTPYLLSQIFGD